MLNSRKLLRNHDSAGIPPEHYKRTSLHPVRVLAFQEVRSQAPSLRHEAGKLLYQRACLAVREGIADQSNVETLCFRGSYCLDVGSGTTHIMAKLCKCSASFCQDFTIRSHRQNFGHKP